MPARTSNSARGARSGKKSTGGPTLPHTPGHIGRIEALTLLDRDFADHALGSNDRQAAWLRATSRWLVDASLVGDNAALEQASAAMRRQHRTALKEKAERLAGAIQALTEVASASADRSEQHAYVTSLEPMTYAARMLTSISQNAGCTSTDITADLNGTDAQTSRAGADLVTRGLAESVRLGRTLRWSTTPRGRQAVAQISALDSSAKVEVETGGEAHKANHLWFDDVFANMGVLSRDNTRPWLVIPPPEIAADADPDHVTPIATRASAPRIRGVVEQLSEQGLPAMLVLTGSVDTSGSAGAPSNTSTTPPPSKAAAKHLKTRTGYPNPAAIKGAPTSSELASARVKAVYGEALYESVVTMWTRLPSDANPDIADQKPLKAIEESISLKLIDLTSTLTDEAQSELNGQLHQKLRNALSVATERAVRPSQR